jgi:hypothetical protein
MQEHLRPKRVAALHMIEPRADPPTAITLGPDKAYDTGDLVNELRSMKVVTALIAQNTNARSSPIDGRTIRLGRLCRLPAHPQAHRGGIRLDQDDRRAREVQFRGRSRRMGVYLLPAPDAGYKSFCLALLKPKLDFFIFGAGQQRA